MRRLEATYYAQVKKAVLRVVSPAESDNGGNVEGRHIAEGYASGAGAWSMRAVGGGGHSGACPLGVLYHVDCTWIAHAYIRSDRLPALAQICDQCEDPTELHSSSASLHTCQQR